MKKCRECGRILPLEDFYKHPKMADGHLNKCKECVKNRVHANRYNNIDRVREYDRKRGKTEKRRIRSRDVTKRRRKQVIGYEKAHRILEHAVISGKIKKLNFCVKCGLVGITEAHHPNYNFPLDVLWLCPACHKKYHNSLDKEHKRIIEMIINYKDGVFC